MSRKTLIVVAILILAGLAAVLGLIVSKNGVLARINPGSILADICVPVLPCGGILISQPVPCVGSGFEWVQIKTALGATISYIFEPTPFLYYIPTHVGQFFVGNDAPTLCHCLTSPHQGFTGPCGWFYGTSV